MKEVAINLAELRDDLRQLVLLLRTAGVPPKLLASIERKCLRSPRRQTGRLDRRTNRQPRWSLADDHPDCSSEVHAQLVRLRLLLDMLQMRNAPRVEGAIAATLAKKYFQEPAQEATQDPLTDEYLDYDELVQDIVGAPKHGYSKFHIGHQDPRSHPKHRPDNVRWQLKTSNDFQGTMDIRVARIAYLVDQFTRSRDPRLFAEAHQALRDLGRDIAPMEPTTSEP